jgi:hypothetical protein
MAGFTAIAAGVGLAATATTTGMSFAQASKQRKLMQDAEREADIAMQEARKKLEINVFDKLSIQKEPFELEREALLSQGAQAIQAGVESERGAAATAGRLQMAQQEGQAGIRTAMGQELQALEKMSATEEGRLRDIGVQLDLEEVAGAQLAAANAQEMGAQAMQQGFQGVTSLAGQLAEAAPLFERNRAAERAAIGGMEFTPEQLYKFGDINPKAGLKNLDFEKISSMSNKEYRRFLKELTPQQKQMLFMNEQFTGKYNQFDPFRF